MDNGADIFHKQRLEAHILVAHTQLLLNALQAIRTHEIGACAGNNLPLIKEPALLGGGCKAYHISVYAFLLGGSGRSGPLGLANYRDLAGGGDIHKACGHRHRLFGHHKAGAKDSIVKLKHVDSHFFAAGIALADQI